MWLTEGANCTSNFFLSWFHVLSEGIIFTVLLSDYSTREILSTHVMFHLHIYLFSIAVLFM
uniref:Uncharacterized protein n=1 Tax=Anguilla anguilla TaxID=7936 RepID=A0A0E9VJM5_ANGAN